MQAPVLRGWNRWMWAWGCEFTPSADDSAGHCSVPEYRPDENTVHKQMISVPFMQQALFGVLCWTLSWDIGIRDILSSRGEKSK